MFVSGVFAGSGTSDYALSKGSIAAAADGYAIRTTGVANTLEFRVDGASAAGSASSTSAVWFDGSLHVAIGTSSGTAQVIYRDGVSDGSAAITHGSISNAVGLAAGADNAGASSHMALAPLNSWGYYDRVLTATEALNLSRYLLGYPGYRAPGGAIVFYDLRDTRCWNGVSTTAASLGSQLLNGAITGSPPTRGIPSDLSILDEF